MGQEDWYLVGGCVSMGWGVRLERLEDVALATGAWVYRRLQ